MIYTFLPIPHHKRDEWIWEWTKYLFILHYLHAILYTTLENDQLSNVSVMLEIIILVQLVVFKFLERGIIF